MALPCTVCAFPPHMRNHSDIGSTAPAEFSEAALVHGICERTTLVLWKNAYKVGAARRHHQLLMHLSESNLRRHLVSLSGPLGLWSCGDSLHTLALITLPRFSFHSALLTRFPPPAPPSPTVNNPERKLTCASTQDSGLDQNSAHGLDSGS